MAGRYARSVPGQLPIALAPPSPRSSCGRRGPVDLVSETHPGAAGSPLQSAADLWQFCNARLNCRRCRLCPRCLSYQPMPQGRETTKASASKLPMRFRSCGLGISSAEPEKFTTRGAMLASNLLRISVVLYLIGLGLGIGMGVAQDFTLAPALMIEATTELLLVRMAESPKGCHSGSSA